MKIILTIFVLGIIVFVGAQPQMPHYEFFNGPWSARKIVDMGLCYVGNVPPYPPPVIYAVNEDTCLAKTTDDGETWEILPKGHNFEDSVKCVAVHSTNPDIVYKGVTGNRYETGIMRSIDGGYFWTLINNGLPDEMYPSKLGIFRQNPDILLLGTYIEPAQPATECLFKTTNGGDNWYYPSTPPPPWDPNILNITDFSFHPDPLMAHIVCLSADQSSDPNNAYRGVWRSEDFGETWQHIGRPDNMPFPEATCVLMVSLDTIYTGYYSQYAGGYLSGINRTTDGGLTWHVCYSYELFFAITDVVVDSANHDNVYASYGSRFLLNAPEEEGRGVIRSTDGGDTWDDWNSNLDDSFVHSLIFNWQDPVRLYAGALCGFFMRQQGSYWVDRTMGMLRANVSDVFPRQSNIVATNANLLMKADNDNWYLEKTFANSASAWGVNPQSDQEILRGDTKIIWDLGINYLRKSTDAGKIWYRTGCLWYWTRIMSTIAYSPLYPLRVYFGFDDQQNASWTFLSRSYDGGETWQGPGIQSDFTNNTIAIDYSNPDIIYIGDLKHNHGVWESTDAGDSWDDFSNGFPATVIIYELSIDATSTYIYAATDHGLWKRRADGSTLWQRIGQDVINEDKVVAVVVNPSETNIIYCATEDASGIGHMYTSPKYGDIWLEIPIEWPLSGARFINDLAIEVNAPDTIYAGTSQGVYKYVDNYISGPISQNTILGGDWIVTGDLTVPGNITLILQPGTELYSVPNFDRCESGIDNSRCEIVIHGTLNPIGTETHPIKFTSLAASPQSKDWYGIRMLNSSQASIDYAHILYGYCGLMASFAQNTNIANSLIQNNYTYGLRLSGSNISINNNTIDNNGYYGIYTIACNGSIESNDITKHTGYGIWINGSVDIISNIVSNEGFLSRSQYGIYFYNGFQNQIVSQNTIKRFGQGGILLGANNSVNINNCSITDNAYYGIKRLRGYGYDKVRDSEILEHETGIYCIDHPAGGMDLGRTPFDMGNNSIYSTGASDWLYVANLGELSVPAVIYAEYNWWGSDPPDPSKFIGPVDYDPWLSGPPSGGGPQSSGETGLNQCSKITRITPNPISRETTIYLSITQPDNIELMIYNICGQRVKTIANRINEPGTYKVSWDGKDEQGDLLAAGVYFVQLKTNAGISSSCKIMLIR